MAKENKLRKLEKKRFELIRNIKLCNDYKKEVIINWNKLKESFNQGFISHEEYYRRLSKSKYNEWLNYYDNSIKYNKNKLIEFNKEINREERRLQISPVISTIIILALIGLSVFIIRPEITGLVIQEGTISFDRNIDCIQCGQHKVSAGVEVNINIIVEFSGTAENISLIDYYPINWVIIDTNEGVIENYNETYNKITWIVSGSNDISRSYILMSPDFIIPPVKYYFFTEFNNLTSDEWEIIVADKPGKISDGGVFLILANSIVVGGTTTASPTLTTQASSDPENWGIFIEDASNNRITDLCGSNQIIINGVTEDHASCAPASSNAVYNDYVSCTSLAASQTVNVVYTIEGCASGAQLTYRLDFSTDTGGQAAFTGTDTLTVTAANQNPSNPVPLVNSTDSLQLNYTNETLACNFLCSDPDTEASMTYDISWYKNGIPDIQFSSQSCTDESYVSTNLESGNTTKNDLWACSVNLTDDESASSSTIFSDNITIENYVPTVDVFSNVTSTEDIGTITVITNADLNANFSDIDATDSSPTTYEIISQENTTVKCYFDPNVLKCDSVANQSGSNNIKFSLNDSSGAGAITDFDVTLTAVNDAPTIPELNLPNNNTQIEENIFTVELNWSNVSDLDPDLDSYTYYLEIWNESTTTNILYANSSISETTNTTSDLVTFPSETADYFWRVLANDGTANSSWSELRNISFSYLITNTAPGEPTGVLLNSTLVAQTNLTNENLAANFLCSDPDTLDTITYDIYWYKEGIYNQSMLSISCSDPEYVSYIFDETNTSKGENWSFSVNVTDIGGLSSPTGFSNNLTIENSAPEINYVSLNNSISPFDGGIRQFEFSFIANDNDNTADLDDTKAIANVSFSTENYLNNSCYAEGDVTGGRNYSCTIEMQYYYTSGSWNYATEIKDDSGIAIQNSSLAGETQTWYYSELTALNLSASVLAWNSLIPSQTNQTATSNPITIENTGNKAILNIFAKAIDLIGVSGKYIPADNFTIGNITSASQAECDYTNQTSAVTPGAKPLVFVNNTNIYPVINTLARGQGSSNNLYYCLFDVPSNLQSESYSTSTGTEWDISVE